MLGNQGRGFRVEAQIPRSVDQLSQAPESEHLYQSEQSAVRWSQAEPVIEDRLRQEQEEDWIPETAEIDQNVQKPEIAVDCNDWADQIRGDPKTEHCNEVADEAEAQVTNGQLSDDGQLRYANEPKDECERVHMSH